MRRGRTSSGRASAALATFVVLLAALTGCTDGAPTATPGTGATSVRPGAPAQASGTTRAQPSQAAPASPAPNGTPPPSTGPATPPPNGPTAATASPGTPGTDPRTGPGDDGGEDARTYCPPTALSFTFRVAGGGAAGRGHGAGPAMGVAVLTVRNSSGHACVLHGSPALTLTDDAGRATLTSAPAKPYAQAFALHPGASGAALVHYTARPCPDRGSAVRVTLPGSATASTLPVLDPQGRPAVLPLCGPPLSIGPFKPGFG
ncbi:DUF4232 domain-containing protein [Streptomyces sp. NPDC006703]|uniref:DUF4232 domain-containing protein n=1 Tax=Streptomyces sp. NPDC006703 TaxID=3364759 RepID=UPI0036A5C5F1